MTAGTEPVVDGDLPEDVEHAADTLVTAWCSGIDRLSVQVTPPQLRALVALERHDSMSMGELGETLGSLPSSVSRLCDRLQAGGLVHRRISEVDRREITIRLTLDGRALLASLRAARVNKLARVLARMAPEARDALLRGLTEFATVTG